MILGILLQIQQATDVAVGQVAETVEKTAIKMNLWELATKGGIIMVVLGIMSLIAVYIFIERFIVLQKAQKEDKNFMNRIRESILSDKLDEATSLCKYENSPISRMVEKGLSRLGKPLNDINVAIENTGKLEVARLERGVAFLATIASLGPMLGFLGTVTGMVTAFYDMAMAGNNIDIQTLSGGIYEAMITTVGGLIVGILANLGYNILISKIENIVFTLEVRTSEFMDLLHTPIKVN